MCRDASQANLGNVVQAGPANNADAPRMPILFKGTGAVGFGWDALRFLPSGSIGLDEYKLICWPSADKIA